MVDENGVQILVEQLGRHFSFELVVPEVQELEGREVENHARELPRETVIAEVELEEQFKVLELAGHRTAESVGVDVEQRQIC